MKSVFGKAPMKIIRTHIVSKLVDPIRLEDYIRANFSEYVSKKGIQKAIKRGFIVVDNQEVKPGIWLKEGHRLDWLEPQVANFPVYEFDLAVVYEDEYLAVINKPSGIVVSGNKLRTVTNALLHSITKSTEPDALLRPQPVHRLDAQTSGVLLVAKTSKALILLNKLFENKEIEKKYQAIVQGEIEGEGVITEDIENKKSETHYKSIATSRSLNNDWVSTVELHPKTGRTHQLRIHLANLGFSIVGDRLYGEEGKVLKGKGLFLCAVGLQFVHPITNEEVTIEIAPPSKFASYIEREEMRWEMFK